MLIATGRMFRSVRPYPPRPGSTRRSSATRAPPSSSPRPASGSCTSPIPLELAREAIAAVEAEGFALNCYVDDDLYVAAITEHARSYADFQSIPVHEVGDLLGWIERPPTKLVVVDDPDASTRSGRSSRSSSAAVSTSPSRCRTSSSWPAPRSRREAGWRSSPSMLGFTAEQTVAFGDGENDLELLEWAGFGVAVENADDGSEGPRRLDLPVRRGRGRRPGDRGAPRLDAMIDLKAARNDPDALPRCAGAEGRRRGVRRACWRPTSAGARSCRRSTSCAGRRS